ncbi:helix-turn-helix transcriptional regulator [uncultured Clostridium sp.]|uniref:helix-turn-helix domain-containing protein n=1 Tax=uncultured Clostridium sp. TaxID=59620 RepID=UPI002606CDBA|nr:helix-turn-helix transcriptional regulator [uncultured Clostridium sp.]
MDNVTNSQNLTAIMERVKSRRLELNLSYQDLAEKTNMSKSTLQRYETGSIKNIPIDKLGIIAKALNIDPIWLLGFTPSSIELSLEEQEYLNNFRKLNSLGQSKVISYTSDLIDSEKYSHDTTTVTTEYNYSSNSKLITTLNKKPFTEEFSDEQHLIPNAACELDGDFSEDDYNHDRTIMEDYDFWNS